LLTPSYVSSLLQILLRASAIPAVGILATGCGITYPAVTEDASSVAGSISIPGAGSAAAFAAGGGAVFGDLADDGSSTVPPLTASYTTRGADGHTRTLTVSAPVSSALPPRGEGRSLICVADGGPSGLVARCDTPSTSVRLTVDTADCNAASAYDTKCVVNVSGQIEITGSDVFNGTISFVHRETWVTDPTGKLAGAL
jgi:hypothetical protein